MASFAVVTAGLIVRAVVEFNGPGTVLDWNGSAGNPLKLEVGERVIETGAGLRCKLAGIGYSYDVGLDCFLAPKPYNSWKLNMVSWDWEPPFPPPEDEFTYYWDENLGNWVRTK